MGERPLRLWIARRLFDYSRLKHEKGPGVRAPGVQPGAGSGGELGAPYVAAGWAAASIRSDRAMSSQAATAPAT